MKKRISARLYPFLCRAVLLPALICSFAAPAGLTAAAAEAAAATGTASADAAAQQTAVPELILSKCYLLESDNNENLADGYYQAILLTEDSKKQFAALDAGLADINTRITDTCKEQFKILAEHAKTYNTEKKTDERAVPATFEYRIVPVRQDDKAVSFFTSSYSFDPGAEHGLTTYKGISLDTASGKEITLDQVVKDKTKLTAAINENIRFMNTGESAGDREESISVAMASVDYFPAWVISDNGVIFRFNPESIGTFAEGVMEAEISFTKYPDLFTGTYGPHTGAYTLPIDTLSPVMADLNDDGTLEKVSLAARPTTQRSASQSATRNACMKLTFSMPAAFWSTPARERVISMCRL